MRTIDASKGSLWKSAVIGNVNDFKHVYALSNHITGKTLHSLVEEITIDLIILAKFTSVLKEGFNYTNFSLEKLMKNDSVLSDGALIVKLAAISSTHAYSAERRECDHPLHTDMISERVGCCLISLAFGVKSSLTCRNCAPNARRCLIEDNRIMLYALQPIKKGAQITDGLPNITNDLPRELRQAVYEERTGLDCDCQVCKDNWPVTNFMDFLFLEDVTLSPRSTKVLNEIKLLSDRIESRDEICLEAKTITKFSKVVKDAIKESPLPSKLATSAILHLALLIEITHGFSKSIVPDKCSDSL